MAAEPYVLPIVTADPAKSPAHSSSHQEPNEQVLRLMQSLGIDPVKTKEVISKFIDVHSQRTVEYLLCEISFTPVWIRFDETKFVTKKLKDNKITIVRTDV